MSKSKIISINSHRGGVGKTHFSINCAYSLMKQNKKILLIDFDILAGNLTHMLEINSKLSINDYIKDKIPIKTIIVNKFDNLDVIPAKREEELLYIEKKAWMNTFRKLIVDIDELISEFNYDLILIDNHPSLIQPSITSLVLSTHSLWIMRFNKYNIDEFSNLLQNTQFKDIITQKNAGIILNLVVKDKYDKLKAKIESINEIIPIIGEISFDIDLLTGVMESPFIFESENKTHIQDEINKIIKNFILL